MRKLVGITAFFATMALLFSAGALPAYADPGNGNGNAMGNGNANGNKGNANANNGNGGNANANNAGGNANGGGGSAQAGNPPGANGTVKVHDWPDHKNGSDMANDPKVCRFELHGFKFDGGQTGRWWIQEQKWGNGDASKAVLSGTYAADGNGDWTSGPHTLPDGHYKLFVEMTHTAGNSGKTVTTYKHKVFKVECAGDTDDKKVDDKKVDDNKVDDNKVDDNKVDDNKVDDNKVDDNGGTTTVDTQTSGDVTIRTETTTFVENGEQIQITRIFNDDVLVLTFDTRSTGAIVAGFESVPSGAAVIEAGGEGPTGMDRSDDQSPSGTNVAGSESAPESALAALGSLPATSTGGAPLGFLGLAITGLGVALLRRQARQS